MEQITYIFNSHVDGFLGRGPLNLNGIRLEDINISLIKIVRAPSRIGGWKPNRTGGYRVLEQNSMFDRNCCAQKLNSETLNLISVIGFACFVTMFT